MPSLFKIGPVVLKKILKGANAFLPFCNYLPLGKGTARHLKKKLNPLKQGCFAPSLVEIGPVVLEKMMKT